MLQRSENFEFHFSFAIITCGYPFLYPATISLEMLFVLSDFFLEYI